MAQFIRKGRELEQQRGRGFVLKAFYVGAPKSRTRAAFGLTEEIWLSAEAKNKFGLLSLLRLSWLQLAQSRLPCAHNGR